MKDRLWQEVHSIWDLIALFVVLGAMGIFAWTFRWPK